MEFYEQMNFVCKVMTANHTNFEAKMYLQTLLSITILET